MAPVVSDFEAIRTVGAAQLLRFGAAGRQHAVADLSVLERALDRHAA
jgi:hypothetical protein